MEFPSKLLENLVYNISQLSGIGKRSALRIALEILRKPKEYSRDLSESIFDFKTKINYCKQCHNISDKEVCDICSNSSRDQSIICVVEDIRDVIAIENTNLYNGLYHVLGGVISPIEGIGPDDLNILSLEKKITDKNIDEIIFALSSTIEADTTSFYLFKILNKFDVKVSVLARGIPVGDQLEYTDEVTLARSIQNRRPYENNISNQ
ncbi:MAG: recombination protein RecR [Flavobacteriales bacterium]|nr:MAG: recombination protein RecR [Flavobacteriales bacterium]CAI8342933.1 MAG: Recombination protein RecR [Flavobacteriales bacterium]|tara:strand:+ start:647 stop:1267 length:621 start_codon:yes stop_codon:yes gene_type:complete